jgi:NADP-dependent 3-hydroxy acid dehydrogenase YdfG
LPHGISLRLLRNSSAGIGEAIVRQLCVDLGMKVVGCARRIERLKLMEDDFRGHGLSALKQNNPLLPDDCC